MKMLRLALVPILMFLCVLPAARPYEATGDSHAASRVHLLNAEPVVTTAVTLPSTTAHVAHLSIAPRLAWQSKHDELDTVDQSPLAAAARGTSPAIDHEAYTSVLRAAATGSVSFRATSLPPPAL